MKHSLFGFSSMERRALCPGSYRMEKEMPELPGNEAQTSGIKCHNKIHEMIMADRLGNPVTIESDQFSAAEIEAVTFCFNQYKAMAYEPMTNYIIESEKSFNFTDLFPEIEISTTDLVGYEPFKIAHVFDWKFNFGFVEEAANNIQLGGYALGAFKEYEVKTVYVHLVEAYAKRVTSYQYIQSEQENIKNYVRMTIDNCMKSFAPLVPSKKACQYCRANNPISCPALLKSMFDKELTTPLSSLQPETIARLLDLAELNATISGNVKQYVYACMISGSKVPGYYLKKGRNSRSWAPEVTEERLVEIGKTLGKDVEQLSKVQLISIPDLEEKWGVSKPVKSALDSLIIKTEGKPILTKEK